MHIVVTGCAGYVGSILTSELLGRGHRIMGVDSLLHGGASLAGLLGHPAFMFRRGDIRDASLMRDALRGAEAVVHLAAMVGELACNRDPDLTRAVNLEASQGFLEEARTAGVGRFVYASTCSNYGKMPDSAGFVDETSPLNPISVYAETKVAVERRILETEWPRDFVPTVLRFSTVYGLSLRPRFDLTVNEFAAEAVVNKKLVVFGEQFWRPYVHVRDGAQAIAAVLAAPAEKVRGEVFNVGGTEENYTKKMLVELIQRRLPETVVEYVKREQDPRDYRVRFTKIEQALGFRPALSVDCGLDEVIAAVRDGVIADFTRPEYRNS